MTRRRPRAVGQTRPRGSGGGVRVSNGLASCFLHTSDPRLIESADVGPTDRGPAVTEPGLGGSSSCGWRVLW